MSVMTTPCAHISYSYATELGGRRSNCPPEFVGIPTQTLCRGPSPLAHQLTPPIYAPKCPELVRRFSQLLDTLSGLCGAPAEGALGQKGSLDDAALFCEHAHLVHGLRAL